ncbi:flagellar basal-body MS-ring/collar protein FliF [Oceanisphaera psychrotolerans]|uniref:Flagellar M-ring protein n=1 Tax=Oceanisphaera psychrotolerans TaxID=1414654 RepID=A0A1J4QF47_9GAMM|nr:flagellar basal-body MS-ring/collar protein FliF [Oceanisphaera psychrotolerans]OIN07782.1 flagellar M-ring protein FliF [Oceanisphaera psychrotolerans]
MADNPLVKTDKSALATSEANSLEAEEQKSTPFALLGNTDILRQVIIVLALAICLALAVFILLWGKEPQMRPLGVYSNQELIETLDFLDAQKVEYTIDGSTVLVRADKFADIQLDLRRSGLSQSPPQGDSILLSDPGFGISQRLERERLNLSRERQLARVIEQYNSVAQAQVLLAIPRENVFVRDKRKPSATVVLNLRRGGSLRQEEVDAIVDTVASAVSDMTPDRVTVTDQNGRLLNSGSQDPLSARTRREFELQQKQEAEYRQKIDAILSPVLGLGNYTAEVDVSLDFSRKEQTVKSFNPDLPAVRSEMVMEDTSAGLGAIGIPGALSNQPPTESDIPEQADGLAQEKRSNERSRRESTRNFELDTTISHTQSATGDVRRLTVSVAVDHKTISNADGTTERVPLTPEELTRIDRLLRGGLGFDVSRGDAIEVVAVAFNRPQMDDIAGVPFYEQPWFWHLARILGAVIVLIVLLLTLVRPMVRRLLGTDDNMPGEVDLDGQNALSGNEQLTLLAQQAEQDDSMFGIREGRLRLPDLHKDEDVLSAVRALVANEPDLAAQVIRDWVKIDD